MDRRTFVKACAATAGAGAAVAAAIAIGVGLAPPREPVEQAVRYFGAHSVAGPAPRGVPYIPIGVEDGVFVAKVAPLSHMGATYHPLAWHAWCGRSDAPGAREDYVGDNVLRYWIPEEHLRFVTPWYKEKLGEPVRPDDFPDDGFGASFLWRSDGADDAHILPGSIVKLGDEGLRLVEAPSGSAQPLRRDELAFFQREFLHEDFVAASAICTHFCCVAGYKHAEALAKPRGAWDDLYCTCHSAQFDFREPVAYSHFPDARRYHH